LLYDLRVPKAGFDPAIRRGARELGLVLLGSSILTVGLTYPIAFRLGHVGRLDNYDGQWSIWIVAWVARTLVVDPLHVFDANTFYPRRGTLAYSENNVGAGLLGLPAYWLSGGNPYAAHNSAVLLSLVLTATGMYYLVRYLTGDRRAASVSAICFAYCPYLFAHTAHIQLMVTAGLPFSMLAFHRMVDRPTAGRAAALGGAMAAQALACGYYGVFLVLMIAFAALVGAAIRQCWTTAAYWRALGIAAVVGLVLMLPVLEQYITLQHDLGFRRSLADARSFSANWSAYVASPTYAHAWMLQFLPRWNEAMFPGFIATLFGIAGLWACRDRGKELAILYGGFILFASWASFGPDAGLYTVLYKTVPFFSLLRAPARFGIVVTFGACVLAGGAITALLARLRAPTTIGALLAAAAIAELVVPIPLREAPPNDPVYRMLAAMPRGAVIEMPFYDRGSTFFGHAKYMLASTAHWMPLVNGYSDYIPPDFRKDAKVLATLPSREGLKILERLGVRYAVFHVNDYSREQRHKLKEHLDEFAEYLKPLYVDDGTRLYEIVAFPR
jgi:hypothetical protein